MYRAGRLASAQRGAPTRGGPGMGLFDAATPLQKRKRNQSVAWLGAAKQIDGELFLRPREACEIRTPQQHFTLGLSSGESVHAPDIARHCQDIHTRPGPAKIISTLELPAVPPSTATKAVATAAQARHALGRLRSSSGCGRPRRVMAQRGHLTEDVLRSFFQGFGEITYAEPGGWQPHASGCGPRPAQATVLPA